MAFCSNSGFGRLVDTDVIYTGPSITCGGSTVNPGDTVREFISVVFLCANDIVVDVEGNSLPTPDGTGNKVAFVGSGTYTKAGQSDVVVPSGHMGILNWDGSVWYLGSSVELPEQTGVDTINPNGDGLPKEKAVADFAPSKDLLGITEINTGTNVIQNLSGGDVDDGDLFDQDTWYNKTTGNKDAGIDFICSKSKIPVVGGGTYSYNFWLYGNAGVVFFDANDNLIQAISTTATVGTKLSGNITLQEDVVSMGVSHIKNRPLSEINFTATESLVGVESKVFYSKKDADQKNLELKEDIGFVPNEEEWEDKVFLTTDSFKHFGFDILLKDTEMTDLLPVTIESIGDDDIWQDGYLRNDGTINPNDTWRFVKNTISLPSGEYKTNLYFRSASYMWVVDRNGNMLRPIQGGNIDGSEIWLFTIDGSAGEVGVKIAVQLSRIESSSPYFLENNETIYISPSNADETGAKELQLNVLRKQSPQKRTPAIISIISDDGYKENDWFISELDVYNYKATFAIITGRFNNPDFYSKEDIVSKLLNQGHEIAGHSVNHTGLFTGKTEDELHYEIGRCKFDLLSIDDRIKATNFISPFGSRNVNVDRVVRQYFDANYITQPATNPVNPASINQPPIDTFFMKRVGIDTAEMNVSKIDLLKAHVDYVKENGGWLIFTIHPHYEEYTNPVNTVDRKQELRDLLDYISSEDVPLMTANQARSYYRNASIGNYRLDDSYYERGINGSEIGTLL